MISDITTKCPECDETDNLATLSRVCCVSHWKRRFSTVLLQKENALFILNSSSHILFSTNRFEPNLGEVLNLDSIHCS